MPHLWRHVRCLEGYRQSSRVKSKQILGPDMQHRLLQTERASGTQQYADPRQWSSLFPQKWHHSTILHLQVLWDFMVPSNPIGSSIEPQPLDVFL